MLPKEAILKKRKDFELVMSMGKMYQSPLFGMLTYEGDEVMEKRFGFIISKKVSKKAVDRNRIKRLLAESVRRNISKFKEKMWVVFLAKKEIIGKKYEEVEKEILKCIS